LQKIKNEKIMATYKKGDYIAVMTNQPDVHFIEMFGHGVSTDNVEPSEYVAKIRNVIDDDNYLIFIVHPTTYRCVVSGSEIIRTISDDELSEEIRQIEDRIEFLAPNVFDNCAVLNGTNTEEKCIELSRLAMNSLFPEYQISSIEQISSELTKKDLLECVDILIKMNRNKKEPFASKLIKKRDYFSEMLQHLRFKEYYTIRVGVEDKKDSDATNYLYLFVDTRFEEGVITRNIQERTRFFRSVGPEYNSIGNYISDFRREILTGDEYIKIEL
jgi:hypothetical protein